MSVSPSPAPPGAYDLLAASILHQAIADAEAGSLAALAWLADGEGAAWADTLGAAGPLRDLLETWERRRERERRRQGWGGRPPHRPAALPPSASRPAAPGGRD